MIKSLERAAWVLGLVACVIGSVYVVCEADRYKKQIRELELRLAEADERVDTFTVRDTLRVAQTRVVEVDKTDYKKQLADKALIKELGLRISELESENRTLLSTRDTVTLVQLNDSVYHYEDKWSYFSFSNITGILDWEVRDSLTTLVTTDYKHHFLWWRWGKRGYKVTIISWNPRCTIEYEKYLRLK